MVSELKWWLQRSSGTPLSFHRSPLPLLSAAMLLSVVAGRLRPFHATEKQSSPTQPFLISREKNLFLGVHGRIPISAIGQGWPCARTLQAVRAGEGCSSGPQGRGWAVLQTHGWEGHLDRPMASAASHTS